MKFLKEWGLFLFIIIAILLSRVFLWSLVVVDGHSMDPTLADKERLVIVRKSTINRFDIVVAKEETADGSTKDDRETCHWNAWRYYKIRPRPTHNQ